MGANHVCTTSNYKVTLAKQPVRKVTFEKTGRAQSNYKVTIWRQAVRKVDTK